MSEHDPLTVEVYLDDAPEPIGVYRPPASFELDTTLLPDGPHRLRIKATDRAGVEGVREVHFTVRNGPGIAVVGLSNGDIVEGKIPVLVNAYAGTSEEQWEPRRAETPAPVPTWSWVLFLLVVAWAMFYWFASWAPSPEYAHSPTFSSPARVAAAAPAAAPAQFPGAIAFDWAGLGLQVYEERCQICHTANGEGIPSFVPTLRGSGIVIAGDPAEHLRRILLGSSGVEPGPGRPWKAWMPPFAELLSDEEIAAVANHERSSWGHSAPPVGPEQVRRLREESGAPRPPAGPGRAVPVAAPEPRQGAGSSGAAFERAALGKEIYDGRCQMCHTASGEGIPNFAPSLVGSSIVTADDPSRQVRQILLGSSGVERGPSYPWAAWMPPFGELFSDEEIAAVANYQRTSWGNNAALARPAQVRKIREATGGSP